MGAAEDYAGLAVDTVQLERRARIAERLEIAPGTARIHVERILGKLGLTSRVQIAAWVLRDPRVLDRATG